MVPSLCSEILCVYGGRVFGVIGMELSGSCRGELEVPIEHLDIFRYIGLASNLAIFCGDGTMWGGGVEG